MKKAKLGYTIQSRYFSGIKIGLFIVKGTIKGDFNHVNGLKQRLTVYLPRISFSSEPYFTYDS